MFTTVYMMSSMELIHSEHTPSLVGLFNPNLRSVLVLLRAWAIWGCEKRVAVMLIGSYAIYFLLLGFDAIFTTMSVTRGSSSLSLRYAVYLYNVVIH